jgi:hypothetical protein
MEMLAMAISIHAPLPPWLPFQLPDRVIRASWTSETANVLVSHHAPKHRERHATKGQKKYIKNKIKNKGLFLGSR